MKNKHDKKEENYFDKPWYIYNDKGEVMSKEEADNTFVIRDTKTGELSFPKGFDKRIAKRIDTSELQSHVIDKELQKVFKNHYEHIKASRKGKETPLAKRNIVFKRNKKK